MNKLRISCNRCSCRGLTLLEVISGIALISTLLVVILMAFGTHKRQLRSAAKKIEATRIADRLLTEWFDPESRIPLQESGVVTGDEMIEWHTQVIERRRIQDVHLAVVRLELYDRSDSESDKPLISIDVLSECTDSEQTIRR